MSLGGAIMWALFLIVVVANIGLALSKRGDAQRLERELELRKKRQAESPYWQRLRGKKE